MSSFDGIPEERRQHGDTEPTYRQLAVLKFIVQQIQDVGYAPTLREIGKQFNIRSTNATRDHILALQKRGFITIPQGAKSRTYIPTQAGRELAGTPRNNGFVTGGSTYVDVTSKAVLVVS